MAADYTGHLAAIHQTLTAAGVDPMYACDPAILRTVEEWMRTTYSTLDGL